MKWRTTLLVLALIALLVAYYLVHKPINLATAATLGGVILDGLTVTLIALTAGGIGRRALRRVSLSYLSNAERIAVEATLGLGIMGVFGGLLGLLGAFRGLILWSILAFAALLTWRDLSGWFGDFRRLVGRFFLALHNNWLRFLALLIGLILGATLLRAFAPPTAWDSLVYHLVVPRQYLSQGQIYPDPENFFFGFPQNVEILYGLALSLAGRDTVAAPLHAWFGVLGLIAIGGIVKRHTDFEAALLAILCPLIGYSFALLFSWAYVDLALFASGAAALVMLSLWLENRQASALFTLGLLLGVALGTKYNAVGLVVVSGLAVIYFTFWRIETDFGKVALVRDRSHNLLGHLFRNLLLIALPALVMYMPWALKGIIYYNNPVYPFVFNGLNWDAERAHIFATAETSLIEAGNAWQILILPIAATVFGIEKADAGSGYFFTAGAWLLSTPLALFLIRRWLDQRVRRLAWLCLVLGAAFVGFWMFLALFSAVGTQTRLMLMGFPAAAAACGVTFWGLGRYPRKPFDLGFVVRVMFALTAILGTLEFVQSTLNSGVLHYLFAENANRETYLDEALGTYYAAMRQLATLPKGSTVRLMWEPRSYYCPPTIHCLPDVSLDHWLHPVRIGREPASIFTQWHEAGENYLLVFEAGFAYYLNEDRRYIPELKAFREELERQMHPIWTGGDSYTLYTWR